MRAFASAIELTLTEPGWWAVAAAGFLGRGGAVLFAGLLLELPSPITVTLIFGLDSVTGTGDPTTGLVAAIAAITGVALLGILAAILIGAWVDAATVVRVNAAPSTGPGPRVLGLAWLQFLGLLPGIAVLALAAPVVRDVAVGELLLPSSSNVPFLVRVMEGAEGPLLRGVFVLAVGEALVTIATRMYLGGDARGSTSQAYEAAVRWIMRRPVAALATWVVGWAVLLGALLPSLWAVALAWGQLRAVLLDSARALGSLGAPCVQGKACPDLLAVVPVLVGAAAACLLFVTVWTAAIVLVGVASAFRSALWTFAARAQPGSAPVVEVSADARA